MFNTINTVVVVVFLAKFPDNFTLTLHSTHQQWNNPSNPNLSLQDDMMIPNNNGFVDPAKLKEQITLVPLNVYSSESDDSDMDHNGIPDIDPGKWLSLSL